jgi:RNA polymerase sigma-70 factor (ECF subfamily)
MTSEQKRTQAISVHVKHADTEANIPLTAHNLSDISPFIEPYRQELHLHCYRLLGSLHDAEDMVQETMLRAWQRFDTFKGAASLRTWLYTIATHACLDVLKKRRPRTLPQAAYPVMNPHSPIPSASPEATWLEPFPDSWLAEAVDNPEVRYTRRESISLAFLTALQLLPPRQRAILILSDVLDWRASEVAHLLELSVSAVNSALYRARVTLAKNYHADDEIAQIGCTDTATSTLLNRYVHAWETDDITGLVALLKEDATLNMPPYPLWYWGRESIGTILASLAFRPEIRNRWHLYPTSANALPAFAMYRVSTSGDSYQAFGMQVVTLDHSLTARQIVDVTIFNVPSLVTYFGFPLDMCDLPI